MPTEAAGGITGSSAGRWSLLERAQQAKAAPIPTDEISSSPTKVSGSQQQLQQKSVRPLTSKSRGRRRRVSGVDVLKGLHDLSISSGSGDEVQPHSQVNYEPSFDNHSFATALSDGLTGAVGASSLCHATHCSPLLPYTACPVLSCQCPCHTCTPITAPFSVTGGTGSAAAGPHHNIHCPRHQPTSAAVSTAVATYQVLSGAPSTVVSRNVISPQSLAALSTPSEGIAGPSQQVQSPPHSPAGVMLPLPNESDCHSLASAGVGSVGLGCSLCGGRAGGGMSVGGPNGGCGGSSLNGSMQSTITTTRRDAAAFLRKIHELEHDLKTSKEASKQMVLSHFQQCKELKKERDELKSEVGLLKMQTERLKEGYQQSVASASTLEELLESARRNSSEMSLHVDRSREEVRHYRQLLENEKRTTSELRDKLSCYGSSSSTRFLYSVADHAKWTEELQACKEELVKVQSRAEADMLKMGQSARKWGTERSELRKALDGKDNEITMLKDQISAQKLRLKQQQQQSQEVSPTNPTQQQQQQLLLEKEAIQAGVSAVREAAALQLVIQCDFEASARQAVQHLESESLSLILARAKFELTQRHSLMALRESLSSC